MKKLFSLLFVALFALVVLPSCEKEEDDPSNDTVNVDPNNPNNGGSGGTTEPIVAGSEKSGCVNVKLTNSKATMMDSYKDAITISYTTSISNEKVDVITVSQIYGNINYQNICDVNYIDSVYISEGVDYDPNNSVGYKYNYQTIEHALQ